MKLTKKERDGVRKALNFYITMIDGDIEDLSWYRYAGCLIWDYLCRLLLHEYLDDCDNLRRYLCTDDEDIPPEMYIFEHNDSILRVIELCKDIYIFTPIDIEDSSDAKISSHEVIRYLEHLGIQNPEQSLIDVILDGYWGEVSDILAIQCDEIPKFVRSFWVSGEYTETMIHDRRYILIEIGGYYEYCNDPYVSTLSLLELSPAILL